MFQFLCYIYQCQGEKIMNTTAKIHSLTDDEKWQAVINCMSEYDGLFYTAVKTTGIFCRPSCRAKKPKRCNVLFFDSPADALDRGFRPCKKCRPMEIVYRPGEELVKKVINLYNNYFNDPNLLKTLVQNLGVSSSTLLRLFNRYENTSPGEYLAKLRIDRVKQMLAANDLSILEAAYCCGFKTQSSFYACFKKNTRLTLGQYKKKQQNQNDN